MKIVAKIAAAMMIAAGLAATAGAADNLLKSTAVGKESGARVFINRQLVKDAAIKFEAGKALVSIPEYQKPAGYAVQLYFDAILAENQTYEFKFKADAAKECTIEVLYILGKAPYTCYAKAPVKLQVGSKEYQVKLAPKQIKGKYESPRSLRFFLGGAVNNKLTISDISLTEVKK